MTKQPQFVGIDLLALKQYRATGKIEDHCYQSIVLVRSRIENIWDPPVPIKPPINVRIRSLPTMPIVEQLGIYTDNVISNLSWRSDTRKIAKVVV